MSTSSNTINVIGFRSAVTGELFCYHHGSNSFVSENKIDWTTDHAEFAYTEMQDYAQECFEREGCVGELALHAVEVFPEETEA